MNRFALSILVVLVAAVAGAQMPAADFLYDYGRVSFSYAQTPFPGYSGDFEAEGDGLPEDGQFPPDQTQAVGGFMVPVTPDSMQTAIYAAVANADGTYDVAMAAIRTLGEPTPGIYPVDVLNGSGVFGFVDDADSIALPDTLDQAHLVAWLTDLTATHKLVSATGSIAIAGVDADTLYGSFSGTMAEFDGGFFFVNLNGGQFNLSGAEIAVGVPQAGLAPTLMAAPNPFNPLTEVRFAMPEAGPVQVRVYDAAGRLVRTLHDGGLGAGEQSVCWDGRDGRGDRAAAGMYLVQARAPEWQSTVKVTLAP